MSTYKFKTQMDDLLHLISHSLYSHKEIFVRELVSNGSDAIDKLHFLTLTEDNYKSFDLEPKITIDTTAEDNVLTISDNGIGMDKEDLISSLGTIAHSGTKEFLQKLTGDFKKDSNLIGQFGIGFYAVFMVADKVEVHTKKTLTDSGWLWTSEGKGSFTLAEHDVAESGTSIKIYLKEEEREFKENYRLRSLVKKYSNHIAYPIFLRYLDKTPAKEGEEAKEEIKEEQLNQAQALWRKRKNEISEQEYNEFYKSQFTDEDDPLLTLHTVAEGTLEYKTLFYIPKRPPFDMYQPNYNSGVSLYVKRTFITDDDKELLPTYLRFVRGIIDSEDLPLNVSREILQKNAVLSQIKNASTKKILEEIKKTGQDDKEKFETIMESYNKVLKEGLYGDFMNKDLLLEIVRFHSCDASGRISLAQYKEAMPEGQKAIYYLSGDNLEFMKASPLLAAYKEKGFDVLLLDDEIDEVVIPMVGSYKETELKSISNASTFDDIKSDEDKKSEEESSDVAQKIKELLGDEVENVVISSQLGSAPSAIVTGGQQMGIQMQKIMKAMGQQAPDVKPILQINPNHELIQGWDQVAGAGLEEDMARLLFDQAALFASLPIKDPTSLARRIDKLSKLALK